MAQHRNWYSRGYLPHFDVPNLIQSVTFRLADSIPQSKLLEDWDALTAEQKEERNRILEDILDSGHGECLLGDPRCATIVQDKLLQRDGDWYRLLAWAIMPNHVHVLLMLMPGCTMARAVQHWKGGSAFEINKLLGRTGALYLREYHDRYMRDNEHLDNTISYIEGNPVKARLVDLPEQWPYSSAGYRRRREEEAG